MGTGFVSKLALASVAAVGMYAPTLGLPLPLNACLQTGGVANAAPSPTCASDLRECLHASAKTGLYGVRYVTADDVARCMEAFNACASGGASRGGTAPNSTAAGDKGWTFPPRFTMKFGGGNAFVNDCQVSGETVSCTETYEPLPDGWESYAGRFTGQISGSDITGEWTSKLKAQWRPECRHEFDSAGPATYSLSPDGTVARSLGPYQEQHTTEGDCARLPPLESTQKPLARYTGTWSSSG